MQPATVAAGDKPDNAESGDGGGAMGAVVRFGDLTLVLEFVARRHAGGREHAAYCVLVDADGAAAAALVEDPDGVALARAVAAGGPAAPWLDWLADQTADGPVRRRLRTALAG